MIACSLGITIGQKMGALTDDYILAAIYGGLLSGLGIGITYRVGASTGGTDLIAKLVQHQKPYMNIGNVLLCVDGIVIAILSFTFSSIEIALYSIVAVFIATKVITFVLEGSNMARALLIITNQPEKIAMRIHQEIGRTATKMNAVGTYTNDDKAVLLCVVDHKQVPQLKQIINQMDHQSFTIVTNVSEALGEGFKKVKSE